MKAIRVETGTVQGDELGFSEKLFSGWLEQAESRLYLHYIISRHKNEGNTQALIRHWLAMGFDVRVVMPRPIMQHILGKFGFVAGREFFPNQYEGPVDVWYRPGQDLITPDPVPGRAAALAYPCGIPASIPQAGSGR